MDKTLVGSSNSESLKRKRSDNFTGGHKRQITALDVRNKIQDLKEVNPNDGKRYEGLVSHARFVIMIDILSPFLAKLESDLEEATKRDGYSDLLESTRNRYKNRHKVLVKDLKELEEKFDDGGNLVGGYMYNSNKLAKDSDNLNEVSEQLDVRKGAETVTRLYLQRKSRYDEYTKACDDDREQRDKMAEQIANKMYEDLYSKIVEKIDQAYQEENKDIFQLAADIKAIPLDKLPPSDLLKKHNKLLEEIKDKILRNDLDFVKRRHPFLRGDSYGQKVENMYDLHNKARDLFRHRFQNPEALKKRLIEDMGIKNPEETHEGYKNYKQSFHKIEERLHDLEKEIRTYGREQRQLLSNLRNGEISLLAYSSSASNYNRISQAFRELVATIYGSMQKSSTKLSEFVARYQDARNYILDKDPQTRNEIDVTDREPYLRSCECFSGEVLEALLDPKDDSKLDALEISCAEMRRIALKVATKLTDAEHIQKFTDPPSNAISMDMSEG